MFIERLISCSPSRGDVGNGDIHLEGECGGEVHVAEGCNRVTLWEGREDTILDAPPDKVESAAEVVQRG